MVSGKNTSPKAQTTEEKTNTALPKIGNVYIIKRPHLRELAEILKLKGKRNENSLVERNANNANEIEPKT
jgi:hypothetical protein